MKDILFDKQSNGCYRNLENQIHSLMNTAHTSSITTRYRYEAATLRFCEFLSTYKLQKFENVKSKHVVAYVDYLKKEGKSASTIKTDLSAIRYFHRLSGSKNQLIDNSKLDLDQRHFAKVDRSILPQELEKLLIISRADGRLDVFHSIALSSTCGFRLNEVASLRLWQLKDIARLKNPIGAEIYVKGKGGRERYIPVRNEEQVRAIREAVEYAEKRGCHLSDYVISDRYKGGVQKTKRSIQNYIASRQHLFVDPNRTDIKDTQKIKENRVHFHSLRHYYCNNLYKELTENSSEKYNKSEARKYCSEALGHGRESVTLIYLK